MNIAILDDLASDRSMASSCLLTYFSKHAAQGPVTIKEYESGEAFLKTFTAGFFQFIFLDYYMDGISGMETARQIRSTDQNVILIFITTSRDYAIDGYKVKASGYLVKPFQECELEEILDLIDINRLRDEEFIELDMGSKPVKLLLHDIIYCDITGHYVQVHTQNMGVFKLRMSFSRLTKLLSAYDNFLPCYRGCIINLGKVQKLDQLNFLMENGERIPFRKKEQALVTEQYTDFLFEKVRKP